jgi:hypothetical protein
MNLFKNVIIPFIFINDNKIKNNGIITFNPSDYLYKK